MLTVLAVVTVWLLLSLPVSVLIGKCIAHGRSLYDEVPAAPLALIGTDVTTDGQQGQPIMTDLAA